MDTCQEFAALLDLYVDGELPPAEAERVQAHLETCGVCRSYVDDIQAIRAAFPTIEDTPVPEGFADGVMAAIRAGKAPRKRQSAPPLGPGRAAAGGVPCDLCGGAGPPAPAGYCRRPGRRTGTDPGHRRHLLREGPEPPGDGRSRRAGSHAGSYRRRGSGPGNCTIPE